MSTADFIPKGSQMTTKDGTPICRAAVDIRNLSMLEPSLFCEWMVPVRSTGPMPDDFFFHMPGGGVGLYVDGKPRPLLDVSFLAAIPPIFRGE
jgi:hypothetical protein